MATAVDDVGRAELAAPPSTQLVLAARHDRYRQLLRTFVAWKQRAQTQCERRKRVAAACRVGAGFCQRMFWTRWQTFVAGRRQMREDRALQGEEEEHSPQEEDLDSDRGDVKGETDAAESASAGEESDDDKNNAAVLLRRRHHFKRWRRAMKKIVESAGVCANGVVRVRSLHAIRRWQGFARMKKDRDALQQRAYFFLYYWLLKRSLRQLGRYALVRKRERMLTVNIVKANRQRLLVKAMQQWRLRLRLHQTLGLWRNYVCRRRHQALLYRPIAEALTRKTHCRLLQFAFGIWEKRHERNHAQHALVRLLDRHLYRKVCERAWKTWKTKVRQLAQLDTFHQDYQERRLRLIWDAWSTQTRKNELRERQRRRAVRHYYLSLLRKGLHGFQAWRTQRHLALNRLESMQDAAASRAMALAFSRWDHFTSESKLQAHKSERALLHYESRLLKRVWSNGLQCFFTRALTKKNTMVAAQEQYHAQTLRRSFDTWNGVWRAERIRDQALNNMLREYVVGKERAVKARVLECWSEFARAKAARRVVSTQVRGQAQQRTVQNHFSHWVTFVSVLRWQQITQARAEQHYKSVIWRKCFKRWRHNIALRRCYRKKTRVSLVHWKLTLQRKAFDGWKQYLHTKRMKQHRIHEALEFRHEQFVRDGLRHWMTAALHLQEQRERQVARNQASNATQTWRRVAAIARHWRYLAIRRRVSREEGQTLERSRNVPRRIQGDMYWQSEHQQVGRTQITKPSAPPGNENTFRNATVFVDDTGSSNWMKERSPLSEFVLLPRNRPQPRRPVEVLLLSQTEPENVPRPSENSNMHEALRCGFDFPVEPFAPLSSPPDNMVKLSRPPQKLPSDTTVTERERKPRQGLTPPTPAIPSREGGDLLLPSITARHLDVLERQLLVLSQRKREWKAFEQQLEILREEAESNPRLISKVRAMEEQHATRTKQWIHTKKRIRSLATEIQQLRSVLKR